MRVRAFDKSSKTYFKSVVLARLNTGWHAKMLLIFPSPNGGCLKFFDCINKEASAPPRDLIQTITPDAPPEWIYLNPNEVRQSLAEHSEIQNKETTISYAAGYPWVFEDRLLFAKLLSNESIPLKGSVFESKIPDFKMNGWNYIEKQEDANYFLDQTYKFHDAVINSLDYVSGAYINEDETFHSEVDIRRVTLRIDDQRGRRVDMVFEGLAALNLRVTGENHSGDLMEASLYVKNEEVFFCDGEASGFNESYEGTWIKAYNLRWRFA